MPTYADVNERQLILASDYLIAPWHQLTTTLYKHHRDFVFNHGRVFLVEFVCPSFKRFYISTEFPSWKKSSLWQSPDISVKTNFNWKFKMMSYQGNHRSNEEECDLRPRESFLFSASNKIISFNIFILF